MFLADAAGDADAVSYTATNTNRFTLSDCNSDRPSYSNADAERVRRPLPTISVPHRYTNANSYGDANAATNAKPNRDAIGGTSPGLEYLDPITG